MMGLSSMGCGGGGNSSTSNLSASAPPFTVERLNPKPNSNPMLHYSDSPYGVEPFSEYPHISAPRAEATIDSAEIMSVSMLDGYRFSASASVSAPSTRWSAHNSCYGGDVKPYYSPYVASLVGEDRVLGEDEGSRYNVSPTRGLSVTPQRDCTQSLFDVEYGPRWVDGLGSDDGKRAKRSEVDGKFSSEKLFVGGSHGYENQTYQGGCSSENRNKFKEDSGVLYKNLHQVSDREVYTGLSSTGYIEDKSCLEQQFGFFQYDSSKTLLTASSPPYPESYPPLVSCATEENFPNYKSSCSPYEKCVRPVDTPYHGRVSVGRSSPTVVIRPPPASDWNLGQGNASHKPTGSENAAGVHNVDSDYPNPSKPKDSGLKPNSKPKDGSFDASPFKFFKQGNAPVSPASVKELSRPLNTRDTSDSKVKATLGSQIPDVNVSSGFPITIDNVQVVNSADESSDFVDHHSTAVDSPCWKGAPSSPFSVFDIESGNCDRVNVNLAEQYGFGHEEHPSLHLTDSNRVFSEKVECNMGNENECGSNSVKLGFEKTLDATCSTSEQSLLDSILDRVWIPPAATKDSNILNNLTSVFDKKVGDTKHLFGEGCVGMMGNDVSESAAVAVLAAENVLASPASQEDATEHATLPDPRLDVSAIVKSMHSLSELLRFHISGDECSLGEENMEILEHVISNLSTCLSKKDVQDKATHKPVPKDLSGSESGFMGIISRGPPHTKCEASNFRSDPNYLHFHKGERNTFSGKKDGISPTVSPSRDDFHIMGDGDMAKAIKKVLEQNFEIDEDMHGQALLFKNLWLEAEAKLCSISYKARFERTKAQMEDIKLKAPKEDDDVAEMTSELCVLPVPAPKARVDTFPKPTSSNISTSGVSGRADCIDSSVLARFNILKSREDNPKPVNKEEQRQQSEIVDGKHADSVMVRFSILKSQEENSKPINTKEEQRSEIADAKHADFIMARFNILKSREESSILVGVHEEKPPQAITDEFSSEKYFRPLVRGQSEDEALDMAVALQPDFQYQASSSLAGGGKFDSFFEHAGYEYIGGSVMNDPAVHVVRSGSGSGSGSRSRMIGENKAGWHDSSSSSEWEHVMKEEFSWKN